MYEASWWLDKDVDRYEQEGVGGCQEIKKWVVDSQEMSSQRNHGRTVILGF